MKTIILYGSPKKLTRAHRLVLVGGMHGHQPPYYVRAELVNLDLSEALERAKPMEDETVLNSVEIS